MLAGVGENDAAIGPWRHPESADDQAGVGCQAKTARGGRQSGSPIGERDQIFMPAVKLFETAFRDLVLRNHSEGCPRSPLPAVITCNSIMPMRSGVARAVTRLV